MTAVQIVRIIDPSFPEIIACVLRDASWREWEFIDKALIFTSASLDGFSVYPQPGVVACQIIQQRTDERGRSLYTIDTEQPWHVESTGGETQFEVYADQVTTAAPNHALQRTEAGHAAASDHDA